jgi:hypothetical protein
LSLFVAAKSNQKLLVAEKASAFISECSLQKQNFLRSYYVVLLRRQTLVFVTLPFPIKARFTFSMRRIPDRGSMFGVYFNRGNRRVG